MATKIFVTFAREITGIVLSVGYILNYTVAGTSPHCNTHSNFLSTGLIDSLTNNTLL
jgi:hypothetical protein